MNINVICVGKLKEKYWKDACAEYLKRLSRFAKVAVIEVPEEPTVDREGVNILNKVKDRDYVITLEINGKELDSLKFAEKIEDLGVSGRSDISFIIGGSDGLGKAVTERSDFALSFSKMTYPHQMMRVILLEQIYRAFKINANETYHK